MNKKKLIFLVVFTGIAFAGENQVDKVRRAIVSKNHKKLHNMLVQKDNAQEVINFIKLDEEVCKELNKLAKKTQAVTAVQETLGEKKYKTWYQIGAGSILALYGGTKLIIGSTFTADELEELQDQGFFAYDRVTDAGITLFGLSQIYYGLVGKTPEQKNIDALAILQLVRDKLSPAPELPEEPPARD